MATPEITNNKQHYAFRTAGRVMTNRVPVIKETAIIADVERLLLKEAHNFETINYIYVVGDDNTLEGVLSLKEIFRLPKTTPIKDVMTMPVTSVRAHTDQERIAHLALKTNLKMIPVIDKNHCFLGVVAPHTIMRIISAEATEDILRFGGIVNPEQLDDVLHLSLWKSLKHRLPWLILGLFGGMLTAGIVNGFENVLSQNLILVAFIPLIVYLADAVGTQMEAFIIRDLAINPSLPFLKYLLRHFSISSLIGLIIGILLFGWTLIWYDNIRVSIVLSISLFFAILASVFTGLCLPYFFGKMRLDPANASGPIATIIQDILSVTVYFTLSGWLL